MVGGWEVEITGRAAEIQDRTAGSRKGVERGRKGAAELLRVVACVVLCDDLLQGEGSSATILPEPSNYGRAEP